MPTKKIRAGFIIFLSVTFLFGCTVELRSPIKISRSKKKEETSPPSKVVYAPPPPAPSEPVAPTELPAPTYQADTASPEQIVILSSEYLKNTRYSILGKVSVKDVSQNGFSKTEAKEALKYEAFRQFGRQAKGITNVTYERETSFFGSDRYYEASGDVIIWAETAPRDLPEAAAPPQKYNETEPAEREPITEVPSVSGEPLEPKSTSAYQLSVSERDYSEKERASAPDGIGSPANILILSAEDLEDYNFWTIGKVSVESSSKDGFDPEQAHEALKVEAFKQYGSNARGIINIDYKKKRRLLNPFAKKIVGASGDVVAWESGQSPSQVYEERKKTPLPEERTTEKE